MTEEIGITNNNMIEDLQGLEVETFKIDQLDELGLDVADTKISLCSSTTSSSCG